MQAVGDIDGDGAVELVVQNPQSDVRAPSFRIFRWTHRAFTLVRTGTLVQTTPGTFPFRQGNFGQGTWIATFKAAGHGQVTALVNRYDTRMLAGEAVLAGDARGFHLVRWLHKLSPVE